jgi:hypothetical protein
MDCSFPATVTFYGNGKVEATWRCCSLVPRKHERKAKINSSDEATRILREAIAKIEKLDPKKIKPILEWWADWGDLDQPLNRDYHFKVYLNC